MKIGHWTRCFPAPLDLLPLRYKKPLIQSRKCLQPLKNSEAISFRTLTEELKLFDGIAEAVPLLAIPLAHAIRRPRHYASILIAFAGRKIGCSTGKIATIQGTHDTSGRTLATPTQQHLPDARYADSREITMDATSTTAFPGP
jgi:hypothetical protein